MSFDLRNAEYKIICLEREIDAFRRELDEATRRLDVVGWRTDRVYNFLWNRIQDED